MPSNIPLSSNSPSVNLGNQWLSNSNIPTVNQSYISDSIRHFPSRQQRDERLEALSEFNLVSRSINGRHPGCTARQTAACVTKNVKDRIVARFVVSEMENHVIYATLSDPYSPSNFHCVELVRYVSESEEHGAEIIRYMANRLKEANSIIVAKILLLIHRLITYTDVKFIRPFQKIVESGDFVTAVSTCRASAIGGPNSDGGAALPLLEVYLAYLIAMSTHIMNITTILGTNIWREKAHNNEFLNRMEMDVTVADLIKQSTEVLMIIASVPIKKELFNLDITKTLFVSLFTDAQCLYVFDSKGIENGFVLRKGTRSRTGLLKWLRVFQAYENVGHSLNTFFDTVNALHIPFPVEIPKFKVPKEGTAARVREGLRELLSSSGELDECSIDAQLANAQSMAGIQTPNSLCQTKLAAVKETQGSPSTKNSEYQGNTVSEHSSHNSASASESQDTEHRVGCVSGFHVPRDKSDYTLRRVMSTFTSVPNTFDSLPVEVVMNDPISGSNPQFSDSTKDARFVIFTEDILGKGSYGTVFKSWDEEEGRHVACKQITHSSQGGSSSSLEGEFEVLTRLHHENIVSVFAFQSEPSVSRIFMEWVPGGSVQDIFRRTGKGLSVSVIRKFMTGALRGLSYLHGKSIVHRDIKPGNMLIDANGVIKITDFGTSKLIETAAADSSGSPLGVETKSVVGTIPYLAPENFKGIYSEKSDVWSLGASAVHMYSGRVPWSEKKFQSTVQQIFTIGSLKPPYHRPSYTADVVDLAPPTGSFLDFLDTCLTYNAEERPSAIELLSHPFIVNEIKNLNV